MSASVSGERWGDRPTDGPNGGTAFQINLHFNDPGWQAQWDEQVRRRRLEMGLPAIDVTPAKDPNPDLH